MAGTIADARALRFLARLHARLLEVALITERLEQTLAIEDLLHPLQSAFNGLTLLQLENDRRYFTSFAGSFATSALGASITH